MHLHRNPKWKQLAMRETEEVLGSKDNVDLTDLSRLQVVSNCLKEALRLTPPAAIIGKQTTEEFVIPQDKDKIINPALHVRDKEREGVPFLQPSLSFPNPSNCRHVGKSIPDGTRILVSAFTMHHHPLLWSNAEKFLPDRWSAKTKETSTPFAFVPF